MAIDPFAVGQAVLKPQSNYMDMAKQIGDSAQATAVTGTFDESKGVAGRVQSLTDQGSPLMSAARTRAKRASAARGLLNSSIAGQAGEQAVIETATPIASGDAQLYQNQQLANQNAQNQVNLANAQIRANTGIAGLQVGENARQFDTGLAWDKDKTGQNLLEQKRQFDAQLGLEGQKLTQNQGQFEAQLGQQAQQFQQNLQLEKDNLSAQREQFAQRLGLDQAQLQLNRDQLSQQDQQFLKDLDQRAQQLAQQESQFTRDQENKVALANLDAQNRERLIEIEAKYKSDIAGNENISRAWGTMMDSINQIQNNPELDYSTKSTLINNTQAAFSSFANFWKKATGGSSDVSDLLNFGSMPPAPAPAPGRDPGRPSEWDYGNPEGFVPSGDRGG